MRSVSVRGVLAELEAELVGRVVHERAAVRREVYLVSCSGVRVREGEGVEVRDGWVKGVFIGLDEEPLLVVVGGCEGGGRVVVFSDGILASDTRPLAVAAEGAAAVPLLHLFAKPLARGPPHQIFVWECQQIGQIECTATSMLRLLVSYCRVI